MTEGEEEDNGGFSLTEANSVVYALVTTAAATEPEWKAYSKPFLSSSVQDALSAAISNHGCGDMAQRDDKKVREGLSLYRVSGVLRPLHRVSGVLCLYRVYID